MKFAIAVGNPPYQIQTGGKTHQTYAEHYLATRKLSKKASLIFPIGWQTSTGKASGSNRHQEIRNDPHIISIDNYPQNLDTYPFKNIHTGGVNILLRDQDHHSATVQLYENRRLINPHHDPRTIQRYNPKTEVIFKKLSKWMKEHEVLGMSEKVSPRNPFGITGPMLSDPNKREEIGVRETPFPGSIALYGKNELGEDKFYYLSENFPKLKREGLDKYKLAWPRSGAYRSWRATIILEPGQATTDRFLHVTFESNREAENFLSYLKTKLYRFINVEAATGRDAMRKVHKYSPDLSNITNPRTGKVGWESDWTDDDLKELFEGLLSKEEWEYIEQVVGESDSVQNHSL